MDRFLITYSRLIEEDTIMLIQFLNLRGCKGREQLRLLISYFLY